MLASLRVDAVLLGATRRCSASQTRIAGAVAFATCERFAKSPAVLLPCQQEEAGKSAEVFPVAAGAGADLALILRADCRRPVRVLVRRRHLDE